jgi:hypothetical protein
VIVNRLIIRDLAEGTAAQPPASPEQLAAAEQRRLQALQALEAPPELMTEEPPLDG